MSTTHVPKPGPIGRGVRVKHVQALTHRWLKYAQADLDKAGSMDDMAYWQGMTDAYSDVLWAIGSPRTNMLATGVSKKLFALIPAAVVVAAIIHESRKDNTPDA